MEHTGSNSFTTTTGLQPAYNVQLPLAIKEGMWFCRHTPHVTQGKATESVPVKITLPHILKVQPYHRNQQILTKHFRYHLILVSVLTAETTAYPFPTQLVVSSSINPQLLQSFSHVLQHAAWTVCLEPLSGLPSKGSSKHSLPQCPPQNFGIFVFPAGIYLKTKQHDIYYSLKTHAFLWGWGSASCKPSISKITACPQVALPQREPLPKELDL